MGVCDKQTTESILDFFYEQVRGTNTEGCEIMLTGA